MRVRKLTAYILRVPLKKPFRHASAVRDSSDNLVVRTELKDGTCGWGEGVPREYVTGETAEGALEQFAATDWAPQLSAAFASWAEAAAICDGLTLAETAENPRGCHGNSLRCAVELSLLDACGKVSGEPLRNVVDHLPECGLVREFSDSVRYSTTIDAEHSRKLWRSALKMRAYGFRHCKVKVGAETDALRLATVRKWIGPRVDLRVDANEAWQAENLVSHVQSLLPAGISCVEQPVPHDQLASLGELKNELGVEVMLDESLTSMHDAEQAVQLAACDLFNIRLSKCGGLLNSLRLAAFAKRHDVGYQLGCHPGETSLLSAAGRHFATAVGGIRYLEGSYDRHVLRESIAEPDMTFRYGGRAPALSEPGLGATLQVEKVAHLLRGEHSTQF